MDGRFVRLSFDLIGICIQLVLISIAVFPALYDIGHINIGIRYIIGFSGVICTILGIYDICDMIFII